jgi:hypothetical protein
VAIHSASHNIYEDHLSKISSHLLLIRIGFEPMTLGPACRQAG